MLGTALIFQVGEGVRVGKGRLRVITGQVAPAGGVVDPERFQAECVEAFVASWTGAGVLAGDDRQ